MTPRRSSHATFEAIFQSMDEDENHFVCEAEFVKWFVGGGKQELLDEGKTLVARPTKAPTMEVVMTSHPAPGSHPVEAAHADPVMAPHEDPVMAPHQDPVLAPTLNSVMAPTLAPVPVAAPTLTPVAAPKVDPVLAPHVDPVMAPPADPVMAPFMDPVMMPHSDSAPIINPAGISLTPAEVAPPPAAAPAAVTTFTFEMNTTYASTTTKPS